MNKRYYGILAIIVSALLIIAAFAASYAYFTATVAGNNEAKTVNIKTATLGITYEEGTDNVHLNENVLPGQSVTKVFTVKNQSSDLETTYSLYFSELINEFTRTDDLKYYISCSSKINGVVSDCDTANGYGFAITEANKVTFPSVASSINSESSQIKIKALEEQTYTLTIKYIYDEENEQDVDQNKTVSTRIQLNEKKDMIKLNIAQGNLPVLSDYVLEGTTWQQYIANANNKYKNSNNIRITNGIVEGKYSVVENEISYNTIIDPVTEAKVKPTDVIRKGDSSVVTYNVGYNSTLAGTSCLYEANIDCAKLMTATGTLPVYGTPTNITFYAEYGMTWEEWLASPYATIYLSIITPEEESNYLYVNNEGVDTYVVDSNGTKVLKTDVIKFGAQYSIAEEQPQEP